MSLFKLFSFTLVCTVLAYSRASANPSVSLSIFSNLEAIGLDSGYVSGGSIGDFYMRINQTMESIPSDFPSDPNAFYLGSYSFNNSRRFRPVTLGSEITDYLRNGVDEYIQLLIYFEPDSADWFATRGTLISTTAAKESELFGTSSDLIGLEETTAVLRLNEVRVGASDAAQFANDVYFIDSEVEITPVPELASSSLLLSLACFVWLTATRRITRS
ncbi:MAG: hypothetical protein ACSHYA_02430 [Opitutaceae bacterium]